ncbi:hypothetical protein [Shewanella baltica]|uniref:hypothetical protein n=1 Tax=Shewanella baltica TaxID=62322 RepID=UPI003D790EE5
MRKSTKRHTNTNTKSTDAISMHLDEMLEMVTEKQGFANNSLGSTVEFKKNLEISDSYEGVPHNDSAIYRDFTLALGCHRDILSSYVDDLYSFRYILTSYIALRKEFLELKQNPNQKMVLARP